MTQTIPIFFTFDRYYVLAACVAFYSLLEKASPRYRYHLYVVHTGLTPRQQRRLQSVVGKFPNATLSFVPAPEYDTGWESLRNKAHFSKEIFYKMTAASMFPQYDRILFSDVDVIFTDDISASFFLYPDEKFYFAGTLPILENPNLPQYAGTFTPEEIKTVNDYEISAGYMLINLKAIRQDDMERRLVDYFQQNVHRLRLPEQDCIALCCHPFIRFMDYKYVVCNHLYALDPYTLRYNTNNSRLANRDEAAKEYRQMLAEVVQLHYPGADKPWNNRHVAKFDEWMAVCRRAGLDRLYLSLQPLFVYQRLQRYSLRRFLGKLKNKFIR